MADQPMNSYELIYLIQPDLDEDQISQVDGRVAQAVEANDGRITSTEIWGQRKLAYPIKNHYEGHYMLHQVEMPPQAVREVERTIRLNENILRFLLVRTDLEESQPLEAVEEVESILDVDEEVVPPAVDEDDDVAEDDEDEIDVSYTDGPVVFMRTQEGRRRNPRHVGREVKLEDISFKRVRVLSRFVDARGRIFSRRKTRVSAKMQRKVTKAIKRARHLALMPYTGEHVRITRKGGK